MQKSGLILLAGLLATACDSSERTPPPDLVKGQREAMEKAKQTEAVIDQGTAERLKRAEKEAK